MATYRDFARFYDRIYGDRTPDVERIRGYVARYLPAARSLLELGCGTGAVLAAFAGEMELTGIDSSPQMLAIAAANAKGARLIEADISTFSVPARFDVVICIFDTLNHLACFDSWIGLFGRVHEHLADGGLFAFDVNTTGRLRRLWRGPAFAQDFGPDTVIMDVTPGIGELSMWDVRIFERIGDTEFRLHHEVIPELGVPLAQIRQALAASFELLEEKDLDDGPVTDESNRVFFAWRHRPTPVAGPQAAPAAAG